jgi:hypothetical protein
MDGELNWQCTLSIKNYNIFTVFQNNVFKLKKMYTLQFDNDVFCKKKNISKINVWPKVHGKVG